MSRGLIVGIGQRGFRVAEVIREDLADITCMRTAVGKEATVQNLSAAIKYSPTARWRGTSQAHKNAGGTPGLDYQFRLSARQRE